MSTTQFKLVQTGPDALTRRVTFPEQPTWIALASRIEALYGIPIQDVGVSYVDSDGDEITLSTHEELQDYYSTVPRVHNNAIKFTVKNLGALRAQQRRPQASPHLFDIEDEDWQGLGIPSLGMFPPPPPPKSPSSAFVETVQSSVTGEPLRGSGSHASSKGKARAEIPNDDASSVVSVLHDDLPDKKPIHVYDFDNNNRRPRSLSRNSSSASSLVSDGRGRSPPRTPISFKASPRPRTHSPIYLHPISRSRSHSPHPRVVIIPHSRSRSRSPPPQVFILPRSRSSSPPRSRSRSRSPIFVQRPRSLSPIRIQVPSDPPSPILDPRPAAETSPNQTRSGVPSLTRDVAELLNALTTAFGAHPELSEGLKNIVRNASQGAYWAAERDAMVNDALRAAQAADNGVARVAELAQEEAGRKVAEALGGVFRALGSIASSSTIAVSPATPTELVQPQSQRTIHQELPEPFEPPRPRSPVIVQLPHRDEVLAHVGIETPNRGEIPLRVPDDPFEPPVPSMRDPPSPVIEAAPPTRPLGHTDHPNSSSPPRNHRHRLPPPPPPFGPPPGFMMHSHHGHMYAPQPPVIRPRSISPPPPGAFYDPYGQRTYSPWYAPPYMGPHAPRRSNTLPHRPMGGRFGGVGPFAPGPPPMRQEISHSTSANSPSNVQRVQLEEAKNHYKQMKEEWRRAKEERRKERERREAARHEKMKQKERRIGPIEGFSPKGSPEPRPPVPPRPSEVFELSSPRKFDRKTYVVIPPSNGKRDMKDDLVKKLAGMGFTSRTHPQIESLVNKHLMKQPAFGGGVNEEELIATVLEELFLSPTPEASGSGSRQEPRMM